MNILFICYWGIDEGLTRATVLPHLGILAAEESVHHITFVTIERDDFQPHSSSRKITHVPLISKKKSHVILTKISDFIAFRRALIQISEMQKIDLMICRSSLAGAIGYLVNRKTKIPYVVESFEPHADYMVESGVWHKFDPRTLIERWFERKQTKSALFLFPVADNFKRELQRRGTDESKIVTVPCCVDLDLFRFDVISRDRIRRELNIPATDYVGIYVGKFGGMYHDEEAFKLYEKAFEFFGPKFWLILVTPIAEVALREQMKKFALADERLIIQKVPHDKVCQYLSAADFAFATYKTTPSKQFLSPIKIGEYWANGLPVLLERGIGDDASIIEHEGGGVILNLRAPEISFQELQTRFLVDRMNSVLQIQPLAVKYRTFEFVRKAYSKVIKRVSNMMRSSLFTASGINL